MEFSDEAFLAKRQGDNARALNLSQEALRLEAAAAELVKDDLTAEPTRSILYRSAASLAIDCGNIREAERLIATALAGDPPAEIAEELRDLLEQVYFERHLAVRKVSLAPTAMQISVSGKAVGYGFVQGNAFLRRVEDLVRLLHRTAARLRNEPFTEQLRPNPQMQVYIAAPVAGSVAVTLYLGNQLPLPGFENDIAERVVVETVRCFSLLDAGRTDHLDEVITDEAYRKNFVELAKRIIPDKEYVTQVGLTAIKHGQEATRVSITRTRRELVTNTPDVLTSGQTQSSAAQGEVTVRGRLRYADATKAKQTIQLIEEESGTKHTIVVPVGMLNDIVRPLWDEVVEIRGFRKGTRLELRDISEVAP